jgi:hypothetical protein
MFVRLHLGFGCGGVYLSSQATQEAEIRRITVSGQPRPKKKKKHFKIHSKWKKTFGGVCLSS